MTINDLDRIKLPKFQRGFVWTASKKNDFVETLHKGFPFGALLVYPESQEADSKLILLDGQQRLSTIQQYKKNPLEFWEPLNKDLYREALQAVNALLDDTCSVDKKTFNQLVNGKIDLAEWTDDVAEDSKDKRKQLRDIVKGLQSQINEYVDLDSLSILAIKFIGSKENIADVFSNLNKGGIPLSKYNIYSAAWVDTEIQLLGSGESKEQDKILDYVKAYYNHMEDKAEFELTDFSEDELSRYRVVTLSELAFALGAFISDKLKSLVIQNTSAQKEIGFGLLGIATNTDNRHLGSLNTKTGEISDNLQPLLEKTATICSDLQTTFSKLLSRMRAGKSDEYVTGLTASFKTLSYFAALWNLEPSSDEYKRSLANIPAYYVYDYWAGNWTSHGDQRLMSYYPSYSKRNYLLTPTSEQMRDAYNQWAADTTPSINFAKEVKSLTTIHANLTYLAHTVPYGETFELEHIIAKKLINASEDSANRAVFGGSLGNCMYLPKKINNKKKEKNLYDVNENGHYDQLIEDSLYFSEDDFNNIGKWLDEHAYESINSLIVLRGAKVADSIINHLLNTTE